MEELKLVEEDDIKYYFDKNKSVFLVKGINQFNYDADQYIGVDDNTYNQLIDGRAKGQLIYVDDDILKLTTIRPSNEHTWDGEKWVLDEVKQAVLLTQQRQQIRLKINILRDSKNCKGVYVESLGKWFDNDDMAYQNLLGFKASLDLIGDYSTEWICADNTIITDFDKAKLTAVITQIMRDKTANVQNALQHKMALAQSEDPLNYDYSSGWTKTYEDFLNEQK
ncbi:DUF4376 domain-containing protein [Avibacterium sp. 21-595]|uniref:DUF4376 domain-containing protein n=1 Tax=Avibacterium sp. 21-595 TaxID=2911527 RepID=UPI0020271198|nr:DUF4376 domain-containing protein [Avibacterium sp. 21-595]URL05969.1 DUF4376 domain-containing protein [Avibacterium sp. 21-595]